MTLKSLFIHFWSAFFLALLAVPASAQSGLPTSHTDHSQQRTAWFLRGRTLAGRSTAALRQRAYQAKLHMRAERSAVAHPNSTAPSPGTWQPLGPSPIASDASGTGLQDYGPVTGRATAIAIDPADPSGNTVYVGAAEGGIWKSINAIATPASFVTWSPISDNQPTLSIGALAIQPGNNDPSKTVILAATGEANNSTDSYFGLGILRSTNGGASWTLISSANSGVLPFTGLGGAQFAFSSANTVVAAMTTTAEGTLSGASGDGTTPGLYTSLDAGQSWTYNAISDPGNQATDATSATSVAYNPAAGLFFAAIRYHGFYSSPDGTHWTRLTTQPGNGMLTASACPAQSTTNSYACPIYRGEITVVPARNELYVWFIYLDSSGASQDGGIWQSTNAGASWTQISDSGITNCGDAYGCGILQGYYNLALLAIPNGSATDLYAGAVNLYKCTISSLLNPTCHTTPFLNLTHAYGCIPIAAPAHVNPAQHSLAYAMPSTGADSGNGLMFFANDGGVYRALNEASGLNSGSCSGSNQFDNLNQTLGSLTELVSFSQHPSDPNTLLAGAQGNGSPGTSSATTSTGWVNVNGGDGGYNAMDPNAPADWFVSNPDIPPGGLDIQECSSGVSCRESNFSSVITSTDLGGDDGGFYFPYALDPKSSTTMLVGTCRIWRGPRLGGLFTDLSPNFDTLGSGTCTGSETNVVRAIATGGPTDSNGSQMIYATTDGPGPSDESALAGGNVWVTTNATAGIPAFAQVTGSINPAQFPISSVAVDSSDATGQTGYVTIMGFTGGPGHIWKTTNAGTTWADFSANLPDAPANAVLVDASVGEVYVGTDVGVFQSSTTSPNWTEVGPAPASGQTGFLPNAPVTALALFNSGGQKILRASTYGRGLWQFNLAANFSLTISNSPQTIFPSQAATFNGTISALNGFTSNITLSCAAGTTSPPSTCTPKPLTLLATTNTPFTITAGSGIGDYNFVVQGTGSDPNSTTEQSGLVTLHVINFGLTTPSPSSITMTPGSTSHPVIFQAIAMGSFNQTVTVSCSTNLSGASCSLTPGTTVSPTSSSPVNMTATVTIPTNASAGSYTATITATTPGAPAPITTTFSVVVSVTPDFSLQQTGTFPTVNAGSTTTSGSMNVNSINNFSGTVSLACSLVSGNGSCSVNPSSVSMFPATVSVKANASTLSAGSYQMTVTGTSGALIHTLAIGFNVADYQISGMSSLSIVPGMQGVASLTFTPSTYYNGQIATTCSVTAIPGATCVLSKSSPIAVTTGSPVSFTATISTPSTASAGNYNVSINTQDTSGAPIHNFNIAVAVGQDFTLSSSTSSQSVTPGQTTAAYNLTVQPVGSSFTGAVSLACSGLPSGAQCRFAPNPVTPGSSAAAVSLTISTSPTTPVGSFTVTLTGTSGSLSHSATVTLNVTAANSLQLIITQPFSTNADPSSQTAALVSVTPNYSGKINTSCNAIAMSGQCSASPANPINITAGIATSLQLTLNIPGSAAPNASNNYNVTLTVTDTSGQPSASDVLPVTVIQDFAVNSSTPSQTISAGQTTGAYNLTVSPIGANFAAAVSLSCSGLPADSVCNFQPTSVTPGTTPTSVVMTISTTAASARLEQSDRNSWLIAMLFALPGILIIGPRYSCRESHSCGTACADSRPRMSGGAKLRTLIGLITLFTLGLLFTSCAGATGNSGGGSGGSGTLPGTYTIKINGSCGSLTHSATVQLTVK